MLLLAHTILCKKFLLTRAYKDGLYLAVVYEQYISVDGEEKK